MAGKSSVEVLKKLEINTIGDLAQSDLKLIMLHLKSHGKMLWEFANGIGTSIVQSEPDEAKGIGNSQLSVKTRRQWRKSGRYLSGLRRV